MGVSIVRRGLGRNLEIYSRQRLKRCRKMLISTRIFVLN